MASYGIANLCRPVNPITSADQACSAKPGLSIGKIQAFAPVGAPIQVPLVAQVYVGGPITESAPSGAPADLEQDKLS